MSEFVRSDLWLPVRDGVILVPLLEDSITAVRPYFAKHERKSSVSSGFRSPEKQLQDVILFYAVKKGIVAKFLELQQGMDEDWGITKQIVSPPPVIAEFHLSHIYWWQRAWSYLLHINMIISPCLDAVCLEDSLRGNGTNRRGLVLKQTAHSRGTCYDVRGGKELEAVHIVLEDARKNPTTHITNLTVEKENNCVHVDCR